MSRAEANIRVKVDVTNPGQFFACCGLLELADRLWPGAEGWFEEAGFCVRIGGKHFIDEFFRSLTQTALSRDTSRVEKKTLAPIVLNDLGLIIDWWIDDRGNKTGLKLWAGNQTSLSILGGLQNALRKLKGADNLFSTHMFLSGRLGVDPRTAWNGLDTGFSPNTQGMKVVTYPAIELLAAIGLQGFRPAKESDGYQYSTWDVPFETCIARAASTGALRTGLNQRFQFAINKRGSYKNFGFSIPLKNKCQPETEIGEKDA